MCKRSNGIDFFFYRWNKGLAICFAVIAFMALIIVVLQKEITAVRTVPEGDPCDVIIQDVDSSRINDVIDRQVKEVSLLEKSQTTEEMNLKWRFSYLNRNCATRQALN